MSHKGTFVVDRGVWDHPILSNGDSFSRREAWLYLLSEAAWEAHYIVYAGKKIEVQRGQVAHSLRYLSTTLGWSTTKVRSFLKRLSEAQMVFISEHTKKHRTIPQKKHTINTITICNYNKYQRSLQKGDTPIFDQKTHLGTQGKEDSLSESLISNRQNQHFFRGHIIRLSEKNFLHWRQSFPQIDLVPELTARDAWLTSLPQSDSRRSDWYASTAAHLRNRNIALKAKVKHPTFEQRSTRIDAETQKDREKIAAWTPPTAEQRKARSDKVASLKRRLKVTTMRGATG